MRERWKELWKESEKYLKLLRGKRWTPVICAVNLRRYLDDRFASWSFSVDAIERCACDSWLCVSQDQFDLWYKVARKVGEQSLLYSRHPTSDWIEEVIVRCLRLSPVPLFVFRLSYSNAMFEMISITGYGDSMCYNDLVRNGVHRPVLKHGPRSLTSMRVFGWQTLMRNESKGRLVCWGRNPVTGRHYRPINACVRFE